MAAKSFGHNQGKRTEDTGKAPASSHAGSPLRHEPGSAKKRRNVIRWAADKQKLSRIGKELEEGDFRGALKTMSEITPESKERKEAEEKIATALKAVFGQSLENWERDRFGRALECRRLMENELADQYGNYRESMQRLLAKSYEKTIYDIFRTNPRYSEELMKGAEELFAAMEKEAPEYFASRRGRMGNAAVDWFFYGAKERFADGMDETERAEFMDGLKRLGKIASAHHTEDELANYACKALSGNFEKSLKKAAEGENLPYGSTGFSVSYFENSCEYKMAIEGISPMFSREKKLEERLWEVLRPNLQRMAHPASGDAWTLGMNPIARENEVRRYLHLVEKYMSTYLEEARKISGLKDAGSGMGGAAKKTRPREYELLGIDADATRNEIKSAYRRLAMKYHPDQNSGSKEAEERFKEMANAYEKIMRDRGYS